MTGRLSRWMQRQFFQFQDFVMSLFSKHSQSSNQLNTSSRTRMQSLSSSNPIQEWLSNALRTRTVCISHRSNLENILQQFPHMCGNIETIETHIRPSWWTSAAKIRIETTKDEVKVQYDIIQMHSDFTTATIYMNDSGIENNIETAIYNSVTNEVSHQHLGSEVEFNVYIMELTAMYLAIK